MQLTIKTKFNLGEMVYHKAINGPEGESLRGVINQLLVNGSTCHEFRVAWESTQESIASESELMSEEEFKLNRII